MKEIQRSKTLVKHAFERYCKGSRWNAEYFQEKPTAHPPEYELPHDKTNKMACAPSEDSDQPGHPPSLIRAFAVRIKKTWVLSYPLSAQRRLIRLGRCPGWSKSLLGAKSFCWFCHEAAHMAFSLVVLTRLKTTARRLNVEEKAFFNPWPQNPCDLGRILNSWL